MGELEASKEPLPRKLWPSMGGSDEPRLDMHANNKELFDKVHGEDQMAVDKLKEGIEGEASAGRGEQQQLLARKGGCKPMASTDIHYIASVATAHFMHAMVAEQHLTYPFGSEAQWGGVLPLSMLV